MKKSLLVWVCSILCCFCFAVAGCGETGGDSSSTSSAPVEGAAASFEFTDDEVALRKFENYALKYLVYDAYHTKLKDQTVTFTSSDESIVKVDEDGMLYAYGVGTAEVTGTIDALTATCSVTVTANSVLPHLIVDKSEINTYPGGTITLSNSVTFNGYEKEDVTYDYYTANAQIATIDSDGKVSGVKVGETTVTVKATFMGAEIYETIPVYVKNTRSLGFGVNNGETVYTSNIKGNVAQISATAQIFENFEKITPTANNLRYFECDEFGNELAEPSGLITLSEDGKITALWRGTAYVSYKWEKSADEIYQAQPLCVYTDIPVLTTDVLVTGEMYGDTLLTYDRFISDLEIEPQNVMAAGVMMDGVEMPLTVEETGIRGVEYRAKEIVVYNEFGYGQIVSLDVITMRISNEQELVRMGEFMKETKKVVASTFNNGSYAYYYNADGYFVLDADIKWTQGTYATAFYTDPNVEIGNGFIGTFDGQGHTIEDLVTGSGGLFCVIASEGVVMKTSFKNAKTTGVRGYGILGGNVFGTVKDIYAEVSDGKMNATGALCSKTVGSNVLFERVILVLEKMDYSGSSLSGTVASTYQSANKFRNVYVIEKDGVAMTGKGGVAQKQFYKVGDKIEEGTYYDGINAFKTTYAKHSGYPLPDGSITTTGGQVTCAYFSSMSDFQNGIETKIVNTQAYDKDGNELYEDEEKKTKKTFARVTKSAYTADFSSFDRKLWSFDGIVPEISSFVESEYDTIIDFDDIFENA